MLLPLLRTMGEASGGRNRRLYHVTCYIVQLLSLMTQTTTVITSLNLKLRVKSTTLIFFVYSEKVSSFRLIYKTLQEKMLQINNGDLHSSIRKTQNNRKKQVKKKLCISIKCKLKVVLSRNIHVSFNLNFHDPAKRLVRSTGRSAQQRLVLMRWCEKFVLDFVLSLRLAHNAHKVAAIFKHFNSLCLIVIDVWILHDGCWNSSSS